MVGEDIDISDIVVGGGAEWIKDNTFKIGVDCQDLFEWFFKVNEVPINEMPDYMCLPVQCEVLRNYRFRYRVVDEGGTRFLCLFKMMEPLAAVNGKKIRHFVFTYRILPSIKGVDVSEVRKRWIDAGVDEEILVSESNPTNWNFYNTKDDVGELFNHKWMQHHRISRMEGLIEVRTNLDGIVDGVNGLIGKWHEMHPGLGGMRGDLRCSSMPSTSIHYHRAYLFNGQVVGYVSGTRFADQLFSMIRKCAGQLGMIDDKFVAHNLGHFMLYDTHRMLLEDENATAMFVFGVPSTSPNLFKHKSELFKNHITYSRIKILHS